MSADVSLVERAVEMTFTSDHLTAKRLKALVASLGLAADNLAVRWAICRSLAEGSVDRLPEVMDGSGKELKGRTLFGGGDLAPLLLAQIMLVEGAERTVNQLREVVLAHWSRGQALLAEELDQFAGSGEDLVLREVDLRTLSTRHADFGAQIIGQRALVADLDRLHDDAWKSSPPKLASAVVVSGPPGSGRTYVAELLARSLSDTVIRVHGTKATTIADLRDPLPEVAHRPPVLLIEDIEAIPRRTLTSAATLTAGASIIGTTSSPTSAPSSWEIVGILPYERDAIAQIVRRKFGWHLEVRRMVALAGRLRPVDSLARAEDLARLVGSPTVTDRDAVSAFEHWQLDRLGLDDRDHRVLAEIDDSPQVTPDHLAMALELDGDWVAKSSLPYLEQLGLAVASSRGAWTLTSIGAETYGN